MMPPKIQLYRVLAVFIIVTSSLPRFVATISCNWEITNTTAKKAEFDNLLKEGIKLIYLDFSVKSDTYVNGSSYDSNAENGLLRWVWTKSDIEFLLRYPEEIHAMSFNLLDGVYIKHMDLQLTIYPEGCDLLYNNEVSSVNILIYDFLTKNETDWKICHRNFENQYWKIQLYNLTAYWVGFDFECFESDCSTEYGNCKTILTKSPVNYVLMTFLLFIVIYFPLLFYFFPENISNKHLDQRLKYYTKFDVPYSVSRLFLNLNASGLNVDNNLKSHAYKALKIAFSQENQILTILVSFCFIFNYIKCYVYQYITPDVFIYDEVYLNNFITIQQFQFNVGENALTFISLTLCIGILTILLTAQIKLMANVKNAYLIPYIWSQPSLKEVDVNSAVGDKYIKTSPRKKRPDFKKSLIHEDGTEHMTYSSKYTIFLREILNRISIIFSSHFYMSLVDPICSTKLNDKKCKKVSKAITLVIVVCLNFIFVFLAFMFPIIYFLLYPIVYYLIMFTGGLSLKETWFIKLLVFLVLIAIAIVALLIMRLVFIEFLSYMLQSFIFNIFIIIPMYELSFKFWAVVVSVITYLRMFYVGFYSPYEELLSKCFSIIESKNQKDTHMISVNTYAKIADRIYPLRLQIVFLVFKLSFLCLMLVVLIEMMTQGIGGENFVDQYLPLLLFIVTPAVAIKLNSNDPKEYIEKHNYLVEKTLEAQTDVNSSKNAQSKKKESDCQKCLIMFKIFSIMCWMFMGVFFLLQCFLKSCECKMNRETMKDVHSEKIMNDIVNPESKSDSCNKSSLADKSKHENKLKSALVDDPIRNCKTEKPTNDDERLRSCKTERPTNDKTSKSVQNDKPLRSIKTEKPTTDDETLRLCKTEKPTNDKRSNSVLNDKPLRFCKTEKPTNDDEPLKFCKTEKPTNDGKSNSADNNESISIIKIEDESSEIRKKVKKK